MPKNSTTPKVSKKHKAKAGAVTADGAILATKSLSKQNATIVNMEVMWKKTPDEHDYPAAANYLSLLVDPAWIPGIIDRLRNAPVVMYHAKDILRASALPLLGIDDEHVRGNISKCLAGTKLSPVLLVRGHRVTDTPLIVADGYHRVCTSYHLSQDLLVPARIVTAHLDDVPEAPTPDAVPDA